jgi:hypothetical protein
VEVELHLELYRGISTCRGNQQGAYLEATGGTRENQSDEPYECAEGERDEEDGARYGTHDQDGPQEDRLWCGVSYDPDGSEIYSQTAG